MSFFDVLTNITSLQAQNYLNANAQFQSQTINEVTSGQRIVNAGDDAAGLAVANTYRSDEAVLTQGIRNANDGLSTLQTIDGGMSNISMLLDRASTLAAQSASQSFQGQRGVLDSEFQNVLTEINRQAQSIGMTAGGAFASDIKVFIGGGRSDTANSTAADAITNGSVDVNLSNSLLDTTSLGLSSSGVVGANVQSGAGNLAAALAAGQGTTLDFSGAGYGPVTVDFTTNFDTTHIATETDLVNTLNAAITTAGNSNAGFAAANIRASVNSSGNLVFSSNQAFAVQDHGANAADAGAILLGGASTPLTTLTDVGTSTIPAVAAAAVTGVGGTQTATFSWTDSTGTAQSQAVTLTTAADTTPALIVGAINANTTLQNAGIFAVLKGAGTIDILKSDGGAFQMGVQYDATGGGGLAPAGGTGGTSTYVSGNSLAGSSAIDILNSTDATAAITALQTAVTNLGQIQGTVGRAENQLGYAINLAQSQNTNLSASEAQIRDADMAAEAANLTKAQILVQAGTAALAQANSAPEAVLALLKS